MRELNESELINNTVIKITRDTYANQVCQQAETTVVRLLDIIAVTALGLAVVGPGETTDFATNATTSSDADSLAVLDVLLGLGAVNGDEVACQVVLATERATTRLVVAHVRLRTVGVVRLDMRLQIEGARKGYSKTIVK